MAIRVCDRGMRQSAGRLQISNDHAVAAEHAQLVGQPLSAVVRFARLTKPISIQELSIKEPGKSGLLRATEQLLGVARLVESFLVLRLLLRIVRWYAVYCFIGLERRTRHTDVRSADG
jgi:hypothetical protein